MEQNIEYPENKFPKGGRGHRAEDRFPSNWKEIMIECGKNGQHNTAIFKALNIHHDTHYEIMKRNEEYAQVYNEYLKHCEDWWFESARDAIMEGKSKMFNQHLWLTIMKNKFRQTWRDETQLDVTTAGEKIENPDPIKIEIIRRNQENE